MKYLLWIDAALLALGAVMTIAIGFVAFIYALYVDASPVMRDGLPGVLVITACFAVVFVLAGAATLGLKRARRWHWPLQLLLALSLPLAWNIISANLRAP